MLLSLERTALRQDIFYKAYLLILWRTTGGMEKILIFRIILFFTWTVWSSDLLVREFASKKFCWTIFACFKGLKIMVCTTSCAQVPKSIIIKITCISIFYQRKKFKLLNLKFWRSIFGHKSRIDKLKTHVGFEEQENEYKVPFKMVYLSLKIGL